jgi:uncharacterized protein YndB with AHSA1/START domain
MPESQRVQRQLLLPASRSEVWTALTDPERVGEWFGAEVEWELRPGGPARFSGDDGSRREGVVEAVSDAAELRFVWWPTDGEAEPPSEVTYTLEDDDDGTRLTVTELPLDLDQAPTCSAARAWQPWDGRLVGLWAQALASCPLA